MEVSTDSRQNPNTDYGLCVTAATRQKARHVQNARKTKKDIDEKRKEESISKKAALAAKKEEAFKRIMKTLCSTNSPLRDALTDHKPGEDAKLAYQHLGGSITNLPNRKKETFVALLLERPEINSADWLSNDDTDKENIDPSSSQTNNETTIPV